MNKYEIILGDSSGDGHNISERFIIATNKTKDEILKAYKLACDKVGWNFHDLSYSNPPYSPFNKGRLGGILRTNQWLFVSTIP